VSLYRLAKAGELRALLQWLKRELQVVRDAGCDHLVLVDRLDAVLADADRELAKIEIIFQTGIPALLRRVDIIATQLENELLVASNFYLGGLQRQTPADREMRQVLLAMAKRLHLDWIEDFLVRLSRPLAIYSIYQRLASIPVFYGPPHLLESIMEIPGIYHELGHSVFSQNDEIGRRLGRVVKTHFDALRRSIGPLPQEQKAARDKDIDTGMQYWNRERLSEMFCDVFASYVCGSANIISMMDLGMRGNLDPFEIHLSDEHPPNAARVFAAHCALDAPVQNQSLLQAIFSEWTGYEKQFNQDRRYKVFCAPELLRALTAEMVNSLSSVLPSIPRYLKPLPPLAQALAITAPIELEDLVSAGVVVLFEAPANFVTWQKSSRPLITAS
jgi:hypothetical protein